MPKIPISGIATAVVLYPIIKRQSQSISLGYVASRTLESTVIVIGIVSVMSVITLRHDVGGAGAANPAALTLVERSLVAIHDWTFLLGPGFCAGFGNGLLLGYLMYKSGLVPRGMALLGLIGGPLIFASGIAILFGAFKNGSPAANLMALPEIAWEASLTIYLIVKGFKPSPNPCCPARIGGKLIRSGQHLPGTRAANGIASGPRGRSRTASVRRE